MTLPAFPSEMDYMSQCKCISSHFLTFSILKVYFHFYQTASVSTPGLLLFKILIQTLKRKSYKTHRFIRISAQGSSSSKKSYFILPNNPSRWTSTDRS